MVNMRVGFKTVSKGWFLGSLIPSHLENNKEKSALRSYQEDPEPAASRDSKRGIKCFTAREAWMTVGSFTHKPKSKKSYLDFKIKTMHLSAQFFCIKYYNLFLKSTLPQEFFGSVKSVCQFLY